MTRRTSGNYRKRGSTPQRHHLLELNVRTASQKRQHRRKAGGVLLKIFTVLVLLVGLAVGVRLGAQRFFFDNPEYSLRHVDAKTDGILTQQELETLTGFVEGKNIFRLDLDLANRKISALPEVRSVNIERVLPDTISVKIERRVPVFLFAGEGETGETFVPGKSVLCDKDGILIQPGRLDPEFLSLPILRGLDPSGTTPGNRFENERLDFAIRLQQALGEIPEEIFKIRSIDVSKEYAAVVTDSSNARFTFGSKDLRGQIERLRLLITHCQETGRHIDTANLMVERNTPVTFALTPESATPKITPVPSDHNDFKASPKTASKKSGHQPSHH